MQFILSEEEARAVLMVLRSNWVPIDLQAIIYALIVKLEKELGS